MTVKRFEAFVDNYIWGIESNNNLLIVDPGDSEPIKKFLHNSSDVKIAGILITHHHKDHIGGIRQLINSTNSNFFSENKIKFNNPKTFSGIPVIGPIGFEKYGVTVPVIEGELFAFGEMQFTVLEIPGHTSDHIGYLCKSSLHKNNLSVFCGDTLFAAGCGKVLGGTFPELFNSLKRLSKLPENTLIYCAHEYTLANIEFASHLFPNDLNIQKRKSAIQNSRRLGLPTIPSTIKEEIQTNPFLRCMNPKEFSEMRIAKDNWNPS
tara:strand:- start:363 stop:1154 length:792 start_codon:yes stop_codon:yes gene_type:complete